MTSLFIHSNIARNKILVHCNAGASRSASVVIAYLIMTQGKSFEEAFEIV